MMTFSNSLYASLKKRGLHNWGFLSCQQNLDFDFNDMDAEFDPELYFIGKAAGKPQNAATKAGQPMQIEEGQAC